MLKRVQHLLQKMQLSSPFVVAETLVDRRHLCGSGYTPVGGVQHAVYKYIMYKHHHTKHFAILPYYLKISHTSTTRILAFYPYAYSCTNLRTLI